MATCTGPECRKEATSGDLCAGHRKQLQRHGRLWPLDLGAWERARAAHFEAAVELRDADSEDDAAFREAERRFWETFEAAARVRPRASPAGSR